MKTTSVLLFSLAVSLSPFVFGEEQTPAMAALEVDEIKTTDPDAAKMVGNYVGMFGTNKISVNISKIVDASVIGYSVVAGNERGFTGPFVRAGEDFKIAAKEPGDHPEDGTFSFVFHPADGTLQGEWMPNDSKLALKTFQLVRREFKYDPAVGEYPQSSTKLLGVKDVENMMSEDLRIMRNEIYARHGYSFRLKEMREYFDQKEWFMPVSVNVMNTLTKTEWSNDILIKRYEKYAKENYDFFGR